MLDTIILFHAGKASLQCLCLRGEGETWSWAELLLGLLQKTSSFLKTDVTWHLNLQ